MAKLKNKVSETTTTEQTPMEQKEVEEPTAEKKKEWRRKKGFRIRDLNGVSDVFFKMPFGKKFIDIYMKEHTGKSDDLADILLLDRDGITSDDNEKEDEAFVSRWLPENGEIPSRTICLLELWKALTLAFMEVSKISGTEADKRILENSVPYLMQMYGGTMSPSDTLIFDIIKLYTSPKLDILVETLPLFGLKCLEIPPVGQSNPLFAHSTRANTILTSINPVKAFHTALQFDPKKPAKTSASYDLRFLLPLLCHILDDKNICDGRKVIAHGWVYFIAKGMSLDDTHMRSMAFLCFHRLILNFQRPKNFRSKDTKIYVHFLNGVKRGIREIGECKISNLLATWLIYVWEVLSQPSSSMFNRVTNCLFAKPTTELTILPDFVPFYNDGDDNRESRIWILHVLYYGLQTKEDWRLAQKSPTVKFLSASFLFEKVKTQRTIISILSHGAEIPEIAEDMVDKYSLPLWLSNITSTSSSLKSDLKKFFDNLVLNCPKTPARAKVFDYVRSRQNWACDSSALAQPFDIKLDQDDEMETGET